MRRRDFLYLSGVAAGAVVLPSLSAFSKNISLEESLNPVDIALKKKMADVALNSAKSLGATGGYQRNKGPKYCQYRILRYGN